MSQLRRERLSETVAEHIIERLFSGRLRSGDRIDLDEIATTLGVSRAPVRDALISLERDGVVVTPLHRGAYVAPFTAATIRDHFSLYGLLCGIASSRAAAGHDDQLVKRLEELYDAMTATRDPAEFDRLGTEFRRRVYEAGGSPRLKVLLRSFGSILRTSFRQVEPDDARRTVLPIYAEELDRIKNGDGDGAAHAAARAFTELAELIVASLEARGVFVTDPDAPEVEPGS